MAGQAFKIRVDGLKEFQAALDDLGKRIGNAVLERSLRKASAPMLALAKTLAPNDDRLRSWQSSFCRNDAGHR